MSHPSAIRCRRPAVETLCPDVPNVKKKRKTLNGVVLRYRTDLQLGAELVSTWTGFRMKTEPLSLITLDLIPKASHWSVIRSSKRGELVNIGSPMGPRFVTFSTQEFWSYLL